jgi:hypothetical protein
MSCSVACASSALPARARRSSKEKEKSAFFIGGFFFFCLLFDLFSSLYIIGSGIAKDQEVFFYIEMF